MPQGTTFALEPNRDDAGPERSPQQSVPPGDPAPRARPAAGPGAPTARSAPRPHLRTPARSLTSHRSLLFRRHRGSHQAGSAVPGLAAWKGVSPPGAGPGGDPGVGARAPAGLDPVSRRSPLLPRGAQPAPTRGPRAGATEHAGWGSPAGLGAAGLGLERDPTWAESQWAQPRPPSGWRQSAERLAR